MKLLILFCFFSFFSLPVFAQKAHDLNINYKLRARIYAASSIKDSLAFGGFGGSDNLPRKIDSLNNFEEKGFFLVIDTTDIITIANKYNGYNLFLVNKCDTIVRLEASDSRLNVIAEAFIDNRWQALEYLPSSWCGNSYHHVYLGINEYWKFNIPKFNGKIKTKIRYKLIIGKDAFLYSNQIVSSINKKQLSDKEGHHPQGLMDPYND